jgi:hypothetical protein
MSLPLLLLVLVAPIGAIDMLYFHLWKYRLYASPRSRGETVTHILRSITVAALAWVLAHYRPMGTWFWAIGALFVIDFVNSVIDVAIEPRSRAALGGVPAAESVIHTVGTTALGAIAALYFSHGWQDRLLPTALTSTTGDLSPWLVLQGELVAVSGVLLTLLELGLLLCSLAGWCLPRRASLVELEVDGVV